MQRFFGRTIYSTGFEHEGGRKDGVLRVNDGSASTFYAGLSFKFSEQHHQQQESQSQQQLSEQTNLAACKSSTSPRFPAAALAAHGNNSNSNININININCNNNININISGSSSNTNITAAALAAHSAAAEAEHVKQFLCQKLPDHIVGRVVMELKTRKGVAICRYTEEELGAISAAVSSGAFRTQLDVGRGLVRLHDGRDSWSSTVSGQGSSRARPLTP
ncbi:unnamed protein product [Polarella glacialis]|uniref:Uncharacterized protein n=1 Tax=Polarella glacialis TaxID=89957 RepID=A0A813FLV3_POLGL|nr:unnamed protein product [Polarella glacialis]